MVADNVDNEIVQVRIDIQLQMCAWLAQYTAWVEASAFHGAMVIALMNQ